MKNACQLSFIYSLVYALKQQSPAEGNDEEDARQALLVEEAAMASGMQKVRGVVCSLHCATG
jgi:hypothetical protein